MSAEGDGYRLVRISEEFLRKEPPRESEREVVFLGFEEFGDGTIEMVFGTSPLLAAVRSFLSSARFAAPEVFPELVADLARAAGGEY